MAAPPSTEIASQTYSFDDYESLPTHRVHVHLMAGGAAGIMEHTFMFPIDSVKTRMQSLCPCPERKCRTPVGGLFSMVKREGILRPIRGINVVAGLAGPAHALYFTIYEKMKHYLTNGRPGFHQYAYGISGCVATLFHDAVMNPAEVVKQRLQMWGSPYKGCVECARCLLKSEGVCAFYRSYATQMLMNVPFQTTHFLVYELVQERLNPKHQYDPKSHVIAGALAGGTAAALTTPLDVCKTALNTQDWRVAGDGSSTGTDRKLNGSAVASPPKTGPVAVLTHRRPNAITVPRGPATNPSTFLFFRPACCLSPVSTNSGGGGPASSTPHCPAGLNGLLDAGRAVYRLRGVGGFFGGIQARVMFQVPSTAISWSIYEFFKYVLTT